MSLDKIYQLEKSHAEKLDELLHDGKYVEKLMGLQGDELRELIDYLSEAVNRLIRIGGTHRKCLHILRKISSTRGVLPSAYEISGTLSPFPGGPIAHGGFCDAHQGSLSITREDNVCIKKLRVYSNGDREKLTELFCKEAIVWKHLTHPNVVPFKGVTLNPPQLVSEWMPGGELREHLKKNSDANPIKLLLGVAEGLAYLHSCEVIHGDLKGPNILVDVSGNARITDFGLASVSRDPSSVASGSGDSGYTPRWTAPEIFRGFTMGNKKSDVFSFAMVVIEVFSGAVPFPDIASQAVPAAIMGKSRPDRPVHPNLTNSLWKLTQKCWEDAANDRPEIEDVVKELKKAKYVPPPKKTRGDPPVTIQEPSSTTIPGNKPPRNAPNRNINGHDEAIPYDVDAPLPGPISPPKAAEKIPPAPRDTKVVGRGTINEPSSRPPPTVGTNNSPGGGSEAAVEDGRSHSASPKRAKQDKERREMGHKKSKNRLEGEGKQGETKEITQKAKVTPEEQSESSGDTTIMPIPKINVIPASRPTSPRSTLPGDNDENHRPVSGTTDRLPIDQSPPTPTPPAVDSETESTVRRKDNQHAHRTPRSPQPNQEKADRPAAHPRKLDQPPIQNRGQTARDAAHPLQLPPATSVVPYETPETVPKKPWWKCCC